MPQLESLRLRLLDHLRDLRALEAVRHARLDVDEGSLSWTSSEGERHTVDVWLGLDPRSLARLAAIPALLEHIEEALAECTRHLPDGPSLGQLRLWWAIMDDDDDAVPYRRAGVRPARRDDPGDIAAAIGMWSVELRRWAAPGGGEVPTAETEANALAALGRAAPPGEISWKR